MLWWLCFSLEWLSWRNKAHGIQRPTPCSLIFKKYWLAEETCIIVQAEWLDKLLSVRRCFLASGLVCRHEAALKKLFNCDHISSSCLRWTMLLFNRLIRANAWSSVSVWAWTLTAAAGLMYLTALHLVHSELLQGVNVREATNSCLQSLSRRTSNLS